MNLYQKQKLPLLRNRKSITSTSMLARLLFLGTLVFSHETEDVTVNERLSGCLKAQEAVPIECNVLFVQNGECVRTNVISIPRSEENRLGIINCTATTPIELSFNGFQLKDYVNTRYVRNAENVFNEATYVFSISFPLDQVGASREIVVRSQLIRDHQTSFFIFRPGDAIFSSNLKPYEAPKHSDDSGSISIPFLEKKLVLPCITNDYRITPVLEPDLGNRVSFVNTKGFILDTSRLDAVAGKYLCKAHSESAEENREEHVSFTVEPKKEAIFEPNEDKVYIFPNTELRISCKCEHRVILKGLFQNREISPTPIVSDTSVLQYGSQFVEKYLNVGDTGNISCHSLSDGNVLKSWVIEVLDIGNNNVLSMKKISEDQIVCQSSIFSETEIKLQVTSCKGERECKLNEFCFDENVLGNSSGSSCLKSQRGQPCIKVGKQVAGSMCLTLPQKDPNFSQGTIRCSAGNHTYQTNYFRGFDGKLYLDWHEAPLSALIDISVPNVTMYPHNSYPFGCKAVSFISDGKLQWVIRGKDGSEILLHKNRIQDLQNYYASERDYQLYTVRESNIRLIYPNDYDVICMVPKWNETGWVRHHKRILVAAKEAPVIEIVSGAAVVIIILIGMVIFVMWRLKQAKDAIRNLTEKEVQEFHEGNPEALKNAGDKEAHEVIDSLPYDQSFEIPREKLIIDSENILGKGAFGTVLKGRVEGMPDAVAVKTVNNDCEVSRFKGFLSELKIMIYIGKHPFIVSLIGASTEKIKEKTLYIVVEFCSNGSLENYLRKNKQYFSNYVVNNEIKPGTLSYENTPGPKEICTTSFESRMTTLDLLRWSYQTANGMQYLADKKVVHADLAARNVLIDAFGNAKITDFGLSRQLFDYTQYVKKQQEPLPWRWMAIESLRELRFSAWSDVWAFGVLLWEIFSLGDMPYPGLNWDIQFVQKLNDGLRMIKPGFSTDAIYNLMLDCWQEDPNARPSFNYLAQYFKSLLLTLDVELEIKTKPLGDNIYVNDNDPLPSGYTLVSELANADRANSVKSRNIYVNS